MTPANVGARSLRKFIGLAALGAAAISLGVAEPASAQGTRISGAGISKVARDTRKLTISAQSSGAASGSGTVQFIHNSPAGLTTFRGTVTCVRSSAGTVQVTGTIDKGETATGALLDGKAFGFTIGTSANPQTFSLPTYGESGAVAACSGGRGESVPVTEDGFKLQ